MSQLPSNAGGLVGQRLDEYEMLALLALGGTAEIYLARAPGVAGFEKYVVVKCLHDHLADDDEFIRMFLDEARLGAQLNHSNIVQTIKLGSKNDRYYMVMEYLVGMSLSMMSRRAVERVPGGLLPVDLILAILAQAAAGLHYSHERRDSNGNPLMVVHRDVSPQNLVITFEGIVKVVDYGIAKAAVRETKTQSGTIKGKFAYMSPEQCLAGDIDRRTDVFALGIILHELLTGHRLFKREATYDTYHAILECNVPAPSRVNPQLDPALDPLVLKALQKKPQDRYPTAEALGEAIIGMLHKRGKSVSAGFIADFFNKYFSQEIEEHGQRMRAIISGRKTTVDEGWDEDDEGSDADGDGDFAPKQTNNLAFSVGRAGESSEISLLDSDLLTEDEDEGDDGDEEASTRIELDPPEAIQKQIQAEIAAARAKAKAKASGKPGSSPDAMHTRDLRVSTGDQPKLPSRPMDVRMPSAGSDRASAQIQAAQKRTLVPGAVQASGNGPPPAAPGPAGHKPPDPSNMRTIIAGSKPGAAKFGASADVRTMIADGQKSTGDFDDPAQAETVLGDDPTVNPIDDDDDDDAPTTLAPPKAAAEALRAVGVTPQGMGGQSQPMPGQPRPGQPMPGQPMPGQPMPGQPRPSQPMPGQPRPSQPMPGQPMPPGYGPPHTMESQALGSGPQPQPAPYGGMLNQDRQMPVAMPDMARPMQTSMRQQLDARLNPPAPGMQTWLLATIFAVAVGVGLGVTLLIAKLT